MRQINIRMSLRQARKRQRGSALVGTAALMIVLGMLAMGLMLLGVNIYCIVEYDSKLSFIARQTALASEKYQYWLGMKRMDYTDQSQIAANVEAYGKGLAKLNGLNPDNVEIACLPASTSMQLPFAHKTSVSPVQVQVSYGNFGVPFNPGGLFTMVNGTRTVTAAVADMSVPAPMLLDVYAMDNNQPTQFGQTAQIPAYGMYYPHGGGIPTNGPDNLNQMHGGLAGPEPGMTMSQFVQSPHDGPIAANCYIGLALSPQCTMSVPVDLDIPQGSSVDGSGNIITPSGQAIDAFGNPINKGH